MEPGGERGLATKLRELRVDLHEGILGDIPRLLDHAGLLAEMHLRLEDPQGLEHHLRRHVAGLALARLAVPFLGLSMLGDGSVSAGLAKLVAENIAQQLTRRVAFRRAMKRAVQNAQRAGALGIRVQCSGRLGGAEMSRTEFYREGRVPLHTLRADIDYGFREARTTYGRIGMVEVLEAMKNHDHYKSALGENMGRGIAVAYWMHGGGLSSVAVNLQDDGTISVATGNPDIGGSRSSMRAMAAEELGIDIELIKPIVGDTGVLGYSHLTAGSRTTFATGWAVVNATREIIEKLKELAAKIWEIEPDGVTWESGQAIPPQSSDGLKPLSLKELAGKATKMGGAIAGHSEINAGGTGAAFCGQIVDVEVDPATEPATLPVIAVSETAIDQMEPTGTPIADAIELSLARLGSPSVISFCSRSATVLSPSRYPRCRQRLSETRSMPALRKRSACKLWG